MKVTVGEERLIGGARMPYFDFVWTREVEEHLADHGITPDDFKYVLENPLEQTRSKSSDLPAVFGYTPDGRYVFAVYEMLDDVTVLPVTCYEVEE